MNNKGWGMTDMLWILAAFGIALIVVTILYVQNFKNFSSPTKMPETSPNIQVTSPTMAKEEEKEKEEHEETSKNSNLSYTEIEELLKSAAIDYVKQFYNDESVSEVIIKVSDLERESLISGIYDYNDPTSSCEGYVRYKKEGNTYDPYVRCGNNYVTAGFNDNLAK